MELNLRLRVCFTQIICTFRSSKPKYNSLLAVLTIMCLEARAQSPEGSGAATPGNFQDTLKSVHDTLAIEEVQVNTGYQRMPKERATGSFVFVDSALLNRSVSTDIISRLKGVAPSLLFDERAGGEPKLSIRGRSTIFANADPLIVVDNFPYEGDLRNINPNDVESVSILRDAAAASIWGVRAGNGVIVITTKKGRANQPTQISVNGNLTFGTKPNLFYLPQISSADLVDLEEFLYQQGYYHAKLDDNVAYPLVSQVAELLNDPMISESEKQIRLESLKGSDLRDDLANYFYHPSIKQQYALAIRGGSERHQYNLSGGFDKNRSERVGNEDDRVNLSAQQTLQPIRNLTIENGIFYSYSQTRLNNALQDIKNSAPYTRLIDDQGNHLPVARNHRLSFAEAAEGLGLMDWRYIPLDELRFADQQRNTQHFRIDNRIDYTWFSGFRTSILYQYQRQESPSSSLFSEDTYFTRNLINMFSVVGSNGVTHNLPKGAYLAQGLQRLSAHSGRFQLDYQLEKDQHTLTLLAGMELREARGTGSSQILYGFDPATGLAQPVNHDSLFRQYPTGSWSTIPSANSISATVDRFRSYYFNGAYSLMRRYAFSLSARIDQSNLFGVRANQRSIPLWSAGMKWDVARENFYAVSWLPRLGLRVTYGYNGNIDNTVTAYTTARYQLESATGLTYASINSLPNADLRGERMAQLNLGIDFGVSENILTGSVDFYKKWGTDLLGFGPLEPTTGTTRFKGNLANMQGRGLDVELTVRPVRSLVQWSSTLMASFTTDKITKYEVLPSNISLYFGDGSLTGGGFTPTTGKPLFSVYSYPWAGLDSETGAPLGYVNGMPSSNYVAISQTATIDSLQYHGRATPSWFGAFRNTVSFKDFSLSFNITYKLGYYFRRSSIRYDYLYASQDGHADYASRWQQPGDERKTNVPARMYPLVAGSDNFYSNASILVEKGDHIRFQDIQFSYVLPTKPVQRMGLSQLRVYLYANNIGVLWRANKHGIDPDYAGDVLPQPRSFSLGLSAQF